MTNQAIFFNKDENFVKVGYIVEDATGGKFYVTSVKRSLDGTLSIEFSPDEPKGSMENILSRAIPGIRQEEV